MIITDVHLYSCINVSTKMLKAKNMNFDDIDFPDEFSEDIVSNIKKCMESLEQILDIGKMEKEEI